MRFSYNTCNVYVYIYNYIYTHIGQQKSDTVRVIMLTKCDGDAEQHRVETPQVGLTGRRLGIVPKTIGMEANGKCMNCR